MAVLSGLATAFGLAWSSLRTWSWKPDADCAYQLSMPLDDIGYAASELPPQLVCIGGGQVEFTNPLWAGPVLLAGIVISVSCGVVAVRYSENQVEAKRSPALIVLCASLVALGIGAALTPMHADGLIEAARRNHDVRIATPSLPPPPRASETPSPPASASQARRDLVELGRIAKRAGGDHLLWPQASRVTSASCQDGGKPGTMYFLNGRFTTRDMDDVHGPAEVRQVSEANEKVASRMVKAWATSGLLAEIEPLHGEWYFGVPPGSPLTTVHIGFTNAVGRLSVTTRCAVRA